MKILFFSIALALMCCQPKGETETKRPVPEPEPELVPEGVSEQPVEPEGLQSPFTVAELGQIEDIVSGMLHIKDKRDGGQWYMCGKKLDENEKIEVATQITSQLIMNMKSLGVDIDPWGIIGTMFNESHFDPCAFGKNPRRTAIEFGLLKKERRGFSHSREKILRAIVDPRMRKKFSVSGYDLGLCQILTRFYPKDAADMTTINGGTRICVMEMQARAKTNKTKAPWLYWQGSKRPAYQGKVNRWVNIMKKAKEVEDLREAGAIQADVVAMLEKSEKKRDI
jgi:hypothetical protein